MLKLKKPEVRDTSVRHAVYFFDILMKMKVPGAGHKPSGGFYVSTADISKGMVRLLGEDPYYAEEY